mgnify:CR=1 FL=1
MIFWIVVIVLILFVVRSIYSRYKISAEKSRDLATILNKCNPIFYRLKALQDGTFTSKMITEHVYNPVDDLYALCLKHKALSDVVKRYGATKDDFSELYAYLFATCPMHSSDGHFVPVSAFAFVQSLDYILRNKNTKENISPYYLMDYFNV